MSLQKMINGAILGVAVGDALGVPVEFYVREDRRQDPVTGMRSGGFHNQKAGTWSDDTSMTLALMDSLTRKGFDCEDQMRCYVDWLWNAKYTAYDEVFDVGGTCKSAIFRFCKGTPADKCGEDGELYCGNGSLMRIMPLALYLYAAGRGELNDETAELIHKASALTHAHPQCLLACGIYCSIVFRLCAGMDREVAVREGIRRAIAYYGRKGKYVTEMEKFAELESIGVWPEQMISGSGYVLHTLQAALWCFLRTDSYADCVLQAVNLGEDTDTTAAVAGGLAGLCYGEESIPAEWLDVLARRQDIRCMCKAFADSLIENVE